ISNLLSEIVLQRIDEELTDSGYSFIRYVDDYTAYCESREEAETFIVDLQRNLSEYRLDINNRKTRFIDLRNGIREPWISEVFSHLPHEWSDGGAIRFLQHCESMASRFPHASVLKYAINPL